MGRANRVFGGGLDHPNVTGGDKGHNTINYGAVYGDNTLLTCLVIEYARTATTSRTRITSDALAANPQY